MYTGALNIHHADSVLLMFGKNREAASFGCCCLRLSLRVGCPAFAEDIMLPSCSEEQSLGAKYISHHDGCVMLQGTNDNIIVVCNRATLSLSQFKANTLVNDTSS